MLNKKRFGVIVGFCISLILIVALSVSEVAPAEPSRAPETGLTKLTPPDVAPVLFMSGTPYEMGYQYGEQAKEFIKIASTQCWANQLAWNKNNKKYVEDILASYKKALQREMPEMDEIFKGMADGSGLSYNDIMIICAWDRPPACTGISAFKNATPDGKTIAGQNFDFGWHPFAYTVITVFFPSAGTGLNSFIAPTPAGLMAPTALNNKGLVFTGNGMPAENHQAGSRTLDGVSTLLCGAYIPMKCNNAEEAKELARSIKITAGVNYHVVDEEVTDTKGKAYCIAGNNVGRVVRQPSDSIIISGKTGDPIYNPIPNHMVCTNHYILPYQTDWNPTIPYTSSINRFRTAEKMVSDKLGSLTVQDFIDIFGSRRYWDGSAWKPSSGDDWTGNSINRHSPGASGTLYTMVTVPKDRVAYISTGDANGTWGTGASGLTGEFVKLELKNGPEAVTAQAGKTAVANMADATKAILTVQNAVLKDRLIEQLNKAKRCYWEGSHHKIEADLIMSQIAIEPGQKSDQSLLNKALALYGKAATCYCKAQAYALQITAVGSQ